ncbi:multiple RNA-binding domain-containing protein 1 [Lophiostoma macrostomum CBS 122681]|uniref:Multiple RNA-binding domain-containing protein 1 n=1 Tax=Lophiostoma macrostomum CBS 122681 TaxID=1314788 RepID=A0A6A6TRW4_9PLEO|nr:multiple RNA-binding domain-containing protein 1 [Lophiostoma macrostomum CBS 122681]
MESSRVFVKGLPPKLSEPDVRKHFAKFPITDVKFFPHRRIGYIGYKTPEDAAKAVKYFNKSFIRMSKIFVEIARPVADHNVPTSRTQRPEHEGTAHDAARKTTVPSDSALKRKRPDDEAAQDPKLKEFLEVMQPPSKTKRWANDEGHPANEILPASEMGDKVPAPGDASDEEYQAINKKPKKPRPTKEPSVEAQPVPAKERAPTPRLEDGQGDSRVATGESGPVSDADWLRSRTSRVLDLVEDDEIPDRRAGEPLTMQNDTEEAQETQTRPDDESPQQDYPETVGPDAADSEPSEEDKIRETGRLYLRNLHFDVSSDDLQGHFSKYGQLEEVHVPVKKSDGKGKGFAFLQYEDPDQAVEAFRQNDGTILQGRLLHIISAARKRDAKLDEFAISKLPLKKQREIKRKSEAAGSAFNWNSLYMNADAVMSTVADRLGVSKADVLDPTSSDAAVKQAHAETHIIQETKTYFAQQGVDLEAFKRSSKGDVAILVKNIPHGTSSDDIRKMFEEYGTVRRFLMPPAGLTAIVEFSNAAHAKVAFRSLAYKKVKDTILYLEKAPKDLIKEGVAAPAVTQTRAMDGGVSKLSATELLQEAAGPEITATATLYVRNLNFTTTTQRLSDMFSPLAGFRSARVKTKTDPKRGVLSMGFGFVEFNSTETASAALRAMDNHNLDGHKIQIKASHKGVDAAEERRKEDAAKKAAGTKIIIKNLPFEASKKDVRALFAPYGQLRSVRVPKKFDSSSRGFGFAEFTTKRDAANAMDALRNTHLLGRRLVLTWAEAETADPEKELEKMQQKVGAQANKVALQNLTGGGRKKFNVAGNNDDLDEP